MDLPGVGTDWSKCLSDLEKGLKASIGEQAFAIAGVPQVIAKRKFPIFVNAVLIKLCDAFHSTSSNFIRNCVVDVLSRCHEDIEDKLVSPAEVSRKLYTVSFSNDPTARALTLRALGWLSVPFKENTTIQDLVKRSLSSHHADELAAAVFATSRYAALSPSFFGSVFDTICALLKSMAYPAQMRRRLLEILRFSQLNELSKVRDCFFAEDPELLLSILTDLSLRSVTDRSTHISDLLSAALALDSSRRSYERAFSCLLKIGRRAPHAWESKHFDLLVERLSDLADRLDRGATTREVNVVTKILSLVRVVLSHPGRLIPGDPSMVQVLRHLVGHTNGGLGIRSEAVKVLAYSAETKEQGEEVVFHTLAFVFEPDAREPELKALLRVACAMCKRLSMIDAFFRSLESIFDDTMLPSSSARCAISEAVLECIDSHPVSFPEKVPHCGRTRDTCSACIACSVLANQRVDFKVMSDWEIYRWGRASARYGRHKVSLQAWDSLSEKVIDQSSSWWFGALAALSKGEAALGDSARADRATEALNCLHRSQRHLTCLGQDKKFGVDFVMARIAFLEAWDQLRLTASFAPMSASRGTTDPACARLFEKAGHAYSALKRSCFDADDRTLYCLDIWAEICEMIRHRLTTPDSASDDSGHLATRSDGRDGWANLQLNAASQRLRRILAKSTDLRKLSDAIGQHLVKPQCMPRLFFQQAQVTRVNLVVSPTSPEGINSVYRLPSDQRLMLKVEGMIEQSRSGNVEKVNKGHLGSDGKVKKGRVASEAIVRILAKYGTTAPVTVLPTTAVLPQLAERRVDVKHGYFAAEAVLSLKESVTVIARVLLIDDRDGILWDTDVQESVRVQVMQTGAGPPAKSRKLM